MIEIGRLHVDSWNLCGQLGVLRDFDSCKGPLNKLIDQIEPSWALLIRNDGLTDKLPEIIREYFQKDKRFQISANDDNVPGLAQENFLAY